MPPAYYLAMPKTVAGAPQVQGQPRQFNEILSPNTNVKRAGHTDQGQNTCCACRIPQVPVRTEKENHLKLEREGTFGQCIIIAIFINYILYFCLNGYHILRILCYKMSANIRNGTELYKKKSKQKNPQKIVITT